MKQFSTAKDVQRKCKNCGCKFMARSADINRGWAKFCSKSCKAREQSRRLGHGRPVDHNDDPSWDSHKIWLS